MSKFLLAALALLSLYFLANRIFVDPKAQVLDKLESLRHLAEVKDVPEHPIQRLQTVEQIVSYFENSLSLNFKLNEIDEVTIIGKKELKEKILMMRSSLDSFELDFSDQKVEIQDTSAIVNLRASALGSMPEEDGKFLDILSAGRKPTSRRVSSAQYIVAPQVQPANKYARC